MKIVGCDLHTRYQQVAMLDAETGRVSQVSCSSKPESVAAHQKWVGWSTLQE